DRNLRVALQHRHLQLDLLGEQYVVCIQELDVASPSNTQTSVAGSRQAFVGLEDITDSRAVLGLQHLTGSISGAVIDDDDLQRPPGLLKDAVNCLTDPAPAVERGDDHADQW